MCKIRDLQRNYVDQEARGNIGTALSGTFLPEEIGCSWNVLFQSFHGYYPTDVCRLRDIDAILYCSPTPGYTRDCLPNGKSTIFCLLDCPSTTIPDLLLLLNAFHAFSQLATFKSTAVFH